MAASSKLSSSNLSDHDKEQSRPNSASGIEHQTADLQRKAADRWTVVTGGNPPSALTGMLLEGAISYEGQCRAYGGLTLQQQQMLSSLAQSTSSIRRDAQSRNRRSRNINSASHSKTSMPASVAASSVISAQSAIGARQATGAAGALPFAIGTEFHREWQGRVHMVMVTGDGLLWSGRTYGSLSAVSHAITGTRWNGYRFSGVRRSPRGVAVWA